MNFNIKLFIILTFLLFPDFSNSQMLSDPFLCSDYNTIDNCNTYEDYGCVWCESLSYCGTCDPCSSELIVAGTACAGDYSTQCYSVSKCVITEIVSYGLMCLFVLVIIGCMILCILPLYQRNNFGSIIILTLLAIISFIGIIILLGTFFGFIVSLFTISNGNELFITISWIMMLYVVLVSIFACLFFFFIIIVMMIVYLSKKFISKSENVDFFDL